ncbi:hypothetical protein OB991_23655 [Bacillus cereus]|nr:hypothetical protein [Bacillus cereus]
MVKVMCSTSGEFLYDSDVTHSSYVWTDYGDVQAITYCELAEIKRCLLFTLSRRGVVIHSR